MVVLDSERLDSYLQADTGVIDRNIGPPQRARTMCSHTYGSFHYFMNKNLLPQPSPFKHVYNYARVLADAGVDIAFFTDNPQLHPSDLGIKEMADNYFMTYRYYDKRNRKNEVISVGETMLRDAAKLQVGDDYYIVVWLTETHQPYNFGTNNTKDLYKHMRSGAIVRFNDGLDALPDKYLKYLQDRQIQATEWCCKKAWNILLKKYIDNAEIIICGDHGESFGEVDPVTGNHYYGHGLSIHPSQFIVPMVHNEVHQDRREAHQESLKSTRERMKSVRSAKVQF